MACAVIARLACRGWPAPLTNSGTAVYPRTTRRPQSTRPHCLHGKASPRVQPAAMAGMPNEVYRWAAQDGPLKGLYRIFLYKIQPNQFHTVLLYNRGTEPHTMYWAAILGGPAA
jgi:hypothetical protein